MTLVKIKSSTTMSLLLYLKYKGIVPWHLYCSRMPWSLSLMMKIYQMTLFHTLKALTMGKGLTTKSTYILFSLWNVGQLTLNDEAKTNDAVQGFHSVLKTLITSMLPNLWKLCPALQKEQQLKQTKVLCVTTGATFVEALCCTT